MVRTLLITSASARRSRASSAVSTVSLRSVRGAAAADSLRLAELREIVFHLLVPVLRFLAKPSGVGSARIQFTAQFCGIDGAKVQISNLCAHAFEHLPLHLLVRAFAIEILQFNLRRIRRQTPDDPFAPNLMKRIGASPWRRQHVRETGAGVTRP